MPKSKGYRSQTRKMFARKHRKHGLPVPSQILTPITIGDTVDIVVNGAVHKGMPHRHYQGRTGIVYDITPRSFGVLVNKQVREKIFKKKVHIRRAHVRLSNCNAYHLNRCNENRIARENAKQNNTPLDTSSLKRQPAGPTNSFIIKTSKATPITLTPAKFEHGY